MLSRIVVSRLQAKTVALGPEITKKELEKAHEYCNEVAAKLGGPGSGPWLFGLDQPTALDAQLVVMIHRLEDAGRENIVPRKLAEYREMADRTSEYRETMGDRTSTMYDGSTKNKS